MSATAARPTRTLFAFLKVEHTLFALPFVLVGWLLGVVHTGASLTAGATWADLALVLAAAVSARTLGMTLNRIIDRRIDAANPRTADRALASGTMRVSSAYTIVAVSALVLGAAAGLLNMLVFALAPLLVALFVAYPYAKRVTWACHFVLGLVFLAAPVGGFLALTGTLDGLVAPLLVGAAAFAWVAGFDIIYALLDVRHDRLHDIRSIPAAFGVRRARSIAFALHAATAVLLAGFGYSSGRSWPFFLAVIAVAALLAYEHASVDANDATAINRAFFPVNAVIGWLVLAGLVADLWFAPALT